MIAHRTFIGIVTAIASGIGVGVAVPDARAGLFRCEKPDGHVTYTDNPAACPSARPHEPRGAVQNVLSAPSPSITRPPAARGGLAAEVEASAETTWRQRKQQKEAELVDLEGRADHLREMVTWCNHGGEVVRTDEIGMRHEVSCNNVRSEFETLETKIAAVRQYLAEGLEDECRRSGCLPGWIR